MRVMRENSSSVALNTSGRSFWPTTSSCAHLLLTGVIKNGMLRTVRDRMVRMDIVAHCLRPLLLMLHPLALSSLLFTAARLANKCGV